MTRRRVACLGAAIVVAGWASACDRAEPPDPSGDEATPRPVSTVAIDPPAVTGAFAPDLAVADGRLVASWLEPIQVDGESGHRLVVSVRGDEAWREPAVVAQGTDFFANWADFPGVVDAGDGALLAHWLAKTGEETYAYSIFLARSTDSGKSWKPLGPLHDDGTPTEHGFVSWLPDGDGARVFWLDGREMVSGGAMTLRTARVGAEIGPAEVLDERVCECCATGAARTAAGPLVVYRDRDASEIRDVSVVRFDNGWSSPASVAIDGWKIPGCPVNGPRVAAQGERVVVAWFTAAQARPRVLAAWSSDGGASFEPPVELDGDAPFGRVDVVPGGEGSAWVTWLAAAGEQAVVKVRRITAGGGSDVTIDVGETSGGRTSGFPRLARIGEAVYVAWLEIEGDVEGRVRIAELTPA